MLHVTHSKNRRKTPIFYYKTLIYLKKKNADLHDLISILDIKTDTLRMFRKDSLQTLNKDGPR